MTNRIASEAEGPGTGNLGVAQDTAEGRLHPYRVLLVLTGVALLLNYVETMVLPAVPTIQKDFSTTASVSSWITSAYLIVGSAISPLFGRLGDAYGKKRFFLISLTFYIIGVGAAGFSPSIYFLLASRALQGIGFAIVPLSLSIVVDVFPKGRIAFAQGIISGTFAIGAAAGLVIGSYIVQDLGWPYAFHTAFILSVILFAIVVKTIRKDSPRPGAKIDYAGAFILMTGITLVLVYLTEAPTLGWLVPEELAFLIPGLALTIFFFVFENRRTSPLIELSLLRTKNALVANVVGIVSGIMLLMIMFAVVYYAELPSPFGLNLDIISVGLTLVPATLVMIFVAPVLGRATARLGPKPVLLASTFILILGLTLFATNRSTVADVTLDSVVSLIGAVSLIVPIVNMVSVSLPQESTAVGLGMNTMLRNLGGAAGPVLATTIMATYTAPLSISILGQTVVVANLPSATAFNVIFEVGIGLAIVAGLISLASRNYKFGSVKS